MGWEVIGKIFLKEVGKIIIAFIFLGVVFLFKLIWGVISRHINSVNTQKPINTQPPANTPLIDITLSQARVIVNDYAEFMIKKAPILADESLLPHPMNVISSALDIVENYMQNLSPTTIDEIEIIDLQNKEKFLSHGLPIARISLLRYITIAPKDRKAVTHLNRYNHDYLGKLSVEEIRKKGYIDLISKYGKH